MKYSISLNTSLIVAVLLFCLSGLCLAQENKSYTGISTVQPTLKSDLPDLNGTWTTAGGTVNYWIRQIGNEVWWVGMSGDQGATWIDAFMGTLNGNKISGQYVTTHGKKAGDHGLLTLQVSADGDTMTSASGVIFNRLHIPKLCTLNVDC